MNHQELYVERYLDWFSQIAYLDPNDYWGGTSGYKLIAPLLLVFPRLVVHAPIGRYAELQKAEGLTASELYRAATEPEQLIGNVPAIVLTASMSFADITYRQQVPYLNVSLTTFDKDIMDRESDLYRLVNWIDPDSRTRSALVSFETVTKDEETKKAVIRRLNEGALDEISGRYQGFDQPEFKPPGALSEYWEELPDQS